MFHRLSSERCGCLQVFSAEPLDPMRLTRSPLRQSPEISEPNMVTARLEVKIFGTKVLVAEIADG